MHDVGSVGNMVYLGMMVVGAVPLGQFCSTSLRTVFARVLHGGRTVKT